MAKRGKKLSAHPSGFSEGHGQAPFESADDAGKVTLPPYVPYEPLPRVRAKIGPGGRVVVPAAFRAAAGLEEGAEVMISLVGKEVRIMTPLAAIQRAQEAVRKLVPPDVSLVDELLAERRAEAAAEDKGG